MVFDILRENDLCSYYEIQDRPGQRQDKKIREGHFQFLDDDEIISKLVEYRDDTIFNVRFYLPQMHCSSCVWLLENLKRTDAGVLSSEVNLLRKEIRITARRSDTSLRKIAENLSRIGYEPHISMEDAEEKKLKSSWRGRILKTGISGFCFANIMMLSFPEYLGLDTEAERNLQNLFSGLILVLSLPVFFYCSSEFFISAWKAIRQKILNIDAPIALAILITFARSIWEIGSLSGVGYLDSMSGIVFFMLAGRAFQDFTYDHISFERNYKSYFPIGVSIKEDGLEKSIPVSKLRPGHRILIRHGELIPADSILFFGKASLDYSFVTGESNAVEKDIGEIVYAGGRQTGGLLELEVVRDVSQSYLTSLWNKDAFKNKKEEKTPSFIHKLSRHFTLFLLTLSLGAFLYWSLHGDTRRGMDALSTVLIVACPCALLLSATFTNGNIVRILGKHKMYVRHADITETLGNIDHIVFDKTGTLTQNGKEEVHWEGDGLSFEEKNELYSIFRQSKHPLSMAIAETLKRQIPCNVDDYREFSGNGIEAEVNNHLWKLGSAGFIKKDLQHSDSPLSEESRVYVVRDEIMKGIFFVRNQYREGLQTLIERLRPYYKLSLLSGDHDSEKASLQKIFGQEAGLYFKQSPEQKMEYVRNLQKKGERVLMIGDGLNDAGALRQSQVGIAVSDNINNFSPACDAILEGVSFNKLDRYLRYCREGRIIISGSFILSLLYNTIGLSYAISGTLSPVIAAILMPASSISILVFTSGLSALRGKKIKS